MQSPPERVHTPSSETQSVYCKCAARTVTGRYCIEMRKREADARVSIVCRFELDGKQCQVFRRMTPHFAPPTTFISLLLLIVLAYVQRECCLRRRLLAAHLCVIACPFVAGEDNVGDQSYRYLTADEMKSLGDDSLPIDVTKDERAHEGVIHKDYIGK